MRAGPRQKFETRRLMEKPDFLSRLNPQSEFDSLFTMSLTECNPRRSFRENLCATKIRETKVNIGKALCMAFHQIKTAKNDCSLEYVMTMPPEVRLQKHGSKNNYSSEFNSRLAGKTSAAG